MYEAILIEKNSSFRLTQGHVPPPKYLFNIATETEIEKSICSNRTVTVLGSVQHKSI